MSFALNSIERRELDRLAQQAIPRLQAELAGYRPSSGPPAGDIPDPVEWAERVSGHPLDDWQKDVLLSSAAHLLLNCSRQVGKTEIVSLKAAYNAKYRHRVAVALAPTLWQSSKIHRRAHGFLIMDNTKFKKKTNIELWPEGGGAVIALPGDRPDLSIRGEVVDDLLVDEASRVKSALITAATPTTATRPEATTSYLSTPAGKRGEFYRAWIDRSAGWERYSVTAYQCPRISREFLARERRMLGPLMFGQEYECQFVADATAVLDAEQIAAVFAGVGSPEPDWDILPVAKKVDDWSKVGLTKGNGHESK